jgi:hypothetical protein
LNPQAIGAVIGLAFPQGNELRGLDRLTPIPHSLLPTPSHLITMQSDRHPSRTIDS